MKSQGTTGYYNDQATVHPVMSTGFLKKIPLKVGFVRFSVVNKGQIGGIGKTCAVPRGLIKISYEFQKENGFVPHERCLCIEKDLCIEGELHKESSPRQSFRALLYAYSNLN